MLSGVLPDLRRWILRRRGVARLGNESTEDVVQSVCREALAGRSKFEHEGDVEFRAWVRTLAERKLVDRARHWNAERRAAARRIALPGTGHDDEIVDRGRTPNEVAADREVARVIDDAIADLAPDQRTVLVLQRREGLTTLEIARRIGRSENAVRILRCRALAALGTRLHRAIGDDA